jgi:hypothetical protein
MRFVKLSAGIVIPVLAVLTLIGISGYAAPIKVEGGAVEGTQEQGLTVYRGIPFAAGAYDNREQLKTMDEYFAWRRTGEGKKFVSAK